MCGICGSAASRPDLAVASMNEAMIHRGPDDGGAYASESLGVAIGARRLSIIDVAGGHQPVGNEDGRVHAVLNGEIYNHPALQALLRRRGHVLRTRSDTEVLVHLYEEFGDDLVHALEGMFAFAILDERRGRLLVARDRFGEKPLFYTTHRGTLTFASELDALLAGSGLGLALDPDAVDEYFVLGYVGAPRSIAKDVRQLPGGHALVWSASDRQPRIRRYWTAPEPGAGPRGEPAQELVAETLRLLETSVAGRMLADVPLGVLLSGGLDSTLLAAVATRIAGAIQTFTVGYDTGTDSELDAARTTAKLLGSDHHELVLTADALAARAPGFLAAIDQPIADPALVALHAVAEFARRHVTVAVGGEGADELFGGYPRYAWLERADRLDGRVPARVRRAAARGIESVARGRAMHLVDVLRPTSVPERHLDWVTRGRTHERPGLYGPALETVDHDANARRVSEALAISSDGRGRTAAALMRMDQGWWLQDDVLPKADRAGMLVSLELRTPYLHRELAEFAASIPPEVHLAGSGKWLLKRVLQKVGPELPRRRKRAFGVPLAQWLRGPLLPLLEAHVSSSSIYEDGFFDPLEVRRRVDLHVDGTADTSATLWPLLTLGMWLDARRAG